MNGARNQKRRSYFQATLPYQETDIFSSTGSRSSSALQLARLATLAHRPNPINPPSTMLSAPRLPSNHLLQKNPIGEAREASIPNKKA